MNIESHAISVTMNFNQMQFTGIMFLFLYLLPTICFSKCECLGLKNLNGNGASCNSGFCYVNKAECRAEGFEVMYTVSNAFTYSQRANIGQSYDFCEGTDDQRIIRTKFCECLGIQNGDNQGSSCEKSVNGNWCYVNRAACQPFDVKMQWSESNYIGDRSVNHIGRGNCKKMEHRCDPLPYRHENGLAIIREDQKETCEYEGLKDLERHGPGLYKSNQLYIAHQKMIENKECRCVDSRGCHVVAIGQLPWCIVDKTICKAQGVLVTPLKSYDDVEGVRSNYGRSQQICKVRENRYPKPPKPPTPVEIEATSVSWKFIGTVAKNLSNTHVKSQTVSSSVEEQILNQRTTTNSHSSTKTQEHCWKVGASLKIKVLTVSGEHQRTDVTTDTESNVESFLNQTSTKYTESITKGTIDTNKYESSPMNRKVYRLQINGKTKSNVQFYMQSSEISVDFDPCADPKTQETPNQAQAEKLFRELSGIQE